MKKFLRKRGADTNQNIFYLVVAVIVLAAAAFGFDQALKAMARGDARQAAASVSNQTRAMFANIGTLPLFTTDTVLQADVLPGNIVTRDDTSGIPNAIVLPSGGSVARAPSGMGVTSGAPRDFDVTYTWPITGRATGICNSLVAGTPENERVESGPLGMDYTITTAGCGTPAGITVQYHR